MDAGVRDVVVVGAGPVGSYAARLLAERGFSVLLLEEHREVGSPVQCAGVVTPRVFEMAGCEAAVVNRLSGARVHAPSGRVLAFDGGRVEAVVVDRRAFDHILAAGAVRAGCDLHLGERLTGLRQEARAVRVVTERGSYEAGAVIGADGAQSVTARFAGLPRCREYLSAYQFQCGGLTLDPSRVEVFLGTTLAPGFFGWLVPHGPSEAYAGLAIAPGCRWNQPPRSAADCMERFAAVACAGGSRRSLHITAAAIPLGGPRELVSGRVALAGDAAGQVKPFSGGGIHSGMVGARMCAEAVERVLDSGDARHLHEYGRRWEAGPGRELRRQYALRRAFLQMGDGEIEELLEILDEPEMLSLVVQFGDIDFPSNLAELLLRKAPVLVKFAGPAIKALL